MYICIYIYVYIFFCIYIYTHLQSVNVCQYHTLYSPHTRTKWPVRSCKLLRLYCLDACMTHSFLLKRRTGQLIVLKGGPSTRTVVDSAIQRLMLSLSVMIGKGRVACVRQCEAVTRDTRTLGTNVPTVSGEWRARTGQPPIQKGEGERTKQRRIHWRYTRLKNRIRRGKVSACVWAMWPIQFWHRG